MTSMRSQILHNTLSRVVRVFNSDLSIEGMRARMDALARRGIRVPRNVQVRPERLGGIHAEWFEEKGKKHIRTILYLHGGGYCVCSLDTHRGLGSGLALAADARLLMPAYRLAPEYPFPAALEDALAAYHWLVQQGVSPKHIAIGGDSAGGGLTLATALSLREAGEPLPGALILISPWTDLTFSGESMRTRKAADPIFGSGGTELFAPAYLGNADPRNPLISPVFADLHDLPPTLIHVGEDEVLLSDSTRIDKKMRAAGVQVTLKVWEDMWHVFQAFAPFLPEAQQSIDEIGMFLLQKVSIPAE